jgi:alpha-N-arabinofuranosidase
MFATAVTDKNTKEAIIKIVNTNGTSQSVDISLKGSKLDGKASVTTLGNTSLTVENSFTTENIKPVISSLNIKGNIKTEIPANSFVVIRAKIK